MIHKNAFKLDKVIEEDDMIKSKKVRILKLKELMLIRKEIQL
jgi:hypothetical protein